MANLLSTAITGTLSTTGNVGIGTTSPVVTLDVVANSGGNALSLRMRPANNDYSFIQGRSNNGTEIIGEIAFNRTAASTGNMLFYTGNGTNSTEKLRITSAGNIGIGTTSPSYRLSINDSAGIEANEEYFYFHSNYSVGSNARAKIRGVGAGGGSGYGGDFRISTRATNNTWNEDAVTVNYAGNVGIGTASPAYTLDVSGTARTTTGTYLGTSSGNVIVGGTTSDLIGGFKFIAIGNTAIQYAASTGTYLRIEPGAADTQVALKADARSGAYPPMAFHTSDTERMRITAAGNVGIGTTIPGSRLQVTATSNSATTVDNGITILNDAGIDNCLAGIRLSTYGDADGGLYPKQFIGAIRDGAFGAGKGSIVFCNRDAADTSVVALSDEKMRILPSGNVGIGTTSPSDKLYVYQGNLTVKGDSVDGGIVNIVRRYSTGPQTIRFWNNHPISNLDWLGARIESADAGNYNGYLDFAVSLGNNANEAAGTAAVSSVMRLTKDARVGIGTTSPAAKLDVAGDIRLGGTATYNSVSVYNNSASGGGGYLAYQNGVVQAFFGAAGWYTGTTDTGVVIGTDSSSRPIRFYTNTERMRITGAGNVGIGTTSPEYKLDVSGDIRIVEGLTMRSNEGSLYSVDGALSYYSSTNGVYLNGAGTSGWLRLNASGVQNDENAINIYGRSAGAYINFRTNNSESMRITSAGNVGIGTTSPGTSKLYVNGNSYINGNLQLVSSLLSYSVVPLTFYHNGNTDTYTRTTIYANQNNTSANTANGIFIERGRLTDSASGEIRYFVIGARGGNIQWQLDGSGNSYQTGDVSATGYGRFNGEGLATHLRVGGIHANLGLYVGSSYNMQFDLGWNGNFIFTRGNSEKFRITYDGKVGIGLTNPQGRLWSQGDTSYFSSSTNGVSSIVSNASCAIIVGPGSTRSASLGTYMAGIGFDHLLNYGSTGNAVYSNQAGPHAWVGIRLYNTPGYEQSDLVFATRSSTSAGGATLERMTVAHNGNVGIATISPTHKLNVYDDVTNQYTVRIQSETGNGAGKWMGIGFSGESANNKGAILFQSYGTSYSRGRMIFALNNAQDQSSAVPTDAVMSLEADGKVGIGTTSPTMYGGSGMEVASSSSGQVGIRVSNSGTGKVEIGSDSTGGYIQTAVAGNNLSFFTGAANPLVMRMTSAGNVGIGTTSPSDKLDVSGNARTSGYVLVNNHSDNTLGYRISNTSGTAVSAMFVNSSNQLVIAAGAVDQVNLNKKVLVNGVALGVNVAPSATAGRIDASNDIVAYSSSDERLKQNITPIENALDKVKSLTGVEFDWKPEYKDAHGYEGHDTGIIAQQVEAVMPSAVRTNDSGFLAVRYEKLIGLLIEGMKEQQAQIDELKAKLDGLTK